MTFLDANVLIDAARGTEPWSEWCREQMRLAHARGPIAVNEIVFSEISPGYASAEAVDGVLARLGVAFVPTCKAALVLAARAHFAYRRRGGTRTGVLPDFFIGAQALAEGATLLTRDPRRYRTDFPGIRLIHP